MNHSVTKNILVITEFRDKVLLPISLELIACAHQIEKLTSSHTTALVLGRPDESILQKISQTGTDVLALHIDGWRHIDALSARKAITCALSHSPDIVIAGNTPLGIEIIPGLSIEMNASCISGVCDVNITPDEKLVFNRNIWGGKLTASVISNQDKVMLTVQPGSFHRIPECGKPLGHIRRENISVEKVGSFLKSRAFPSKETESSFDDADVIVAAGRGIQAPENLKKIEAFSKRFNRSAVAGSRPLIDAGWLPYRCQVGITGKTVSPNLYIACGISGSSQHVYGMAGSDFIVSINSDPNAAIFQISDVCIVSDVIAFIDTFIHLEEA
ncbi:MAG: electron transfer flavoprotein subunit alpha/FixB family protein [Candidatus Magnetomorum sp.]|nr:electron transfer flavoprotein subunit alpha/FixB family protein [Candidatus Magnetomorum sp.]